MSYDTDVVRKLVDRYETYLKKDNYDFIFKDLCSGSRDGSWDESDALLDFLFSIDINPLDYMTSIPTGMFVEFNFPEKYRNLVLPSRIKEIGKSAFANCVNLESIDMSQTQVTEIPDSCFGDSLESIKLPKTLKVIGKHAFFCAELESLDIPEGVEVIGVGALDGLSIKSLTLPKSLKIIADDNITGIDIDIIQEIKVVKGSYAADYVENWITNLGEDDPEWEKDFRKTVLHYI